MADLLEIQKEMERYNRRHGNNEADAIHSYRGVQKRRPHKRNIA